MQQPKKWKKSEKVRQGSSCFLADAFRMPFVRSRTYFALVFVLVTFGILLRSFLIGDDVEAAEQKAMELYEERREGLRIEFDRARMDVSFVRLPRALRRGCRVHALVAVISTPESVEMRAAIRSTWASPLESEAVKSGRASVFFVVGDSNEKKTKAALLEESISHGDLLLIDALDVHPNRIHKAITVVHVGAFFCSSELIVKVNESIVVNIDRMLDREKTWLKTDDAAVYGVLASQKAREPIAAHDTKQKFLSNGGEVVPATESFPPYVSGFFYILTAHAARRILHGSTINAAMNLPEDVLVTGFAAHAQEVTLREPPPGSVAVIENILSRETQKCKSIVCGTAKTPRAVSRLWGEMRESETSMRKEKEMQLFADRTDLLLALR